jgi:DNA-binding response OmpR family regulator
LITSNALAKRSDLMGKILVAAFNDDEAQSFDKLMHILEKNGYMSWREVSPAELLEYDDLVIDTKKRNIQRDGKNINLTQYEFDILYLLASSPGQVFSKAQIYDQVWKTPYYGAEDNVMSLIRRIRKKIEPDPAKPIYILTVWGVGYKFNEAIKRK